MAKKPIKVTEVVLRDAHQSLLATRMTMDEMRPILPEMDKINYFSVECWGGATFDSCIRFLDEDPWERLRILRKELPHQKLQMLFRGQNMLGYRPYADDAVEYFVQKSVANGIDVIRIFDALNDPRNLQTAIKAANKEGAHVQGCISYTLSPVHNNEYFAAYAKTLEEMGANSICIKDMAGLLTPYTCYDLVKKLKETVSIPVDIHSHYTAGLASMSILKGIEAGADIIDTAMSPLSLGTSHMPTESLVAALQGTDYDTGLDLKQLNVVRAYFAKLREKYIANGQISPKSLGVDANTLLYQVPGGMFSNMLKQLKDAGKEDKLDEVLAEIPRVREDAGYPPLVTPTSQIVGTQAVFNVILGERYKMVTKEFKGLVHGDYGKTPAPIKPEFTKKILGDEQPITCRCAEHTADKGKHQHHNADRHHGFAEAAVILRGTFAQRNACHAARNRAQTANRNNQHDNQNLDCSRDFCIRIHGIFLFIFGITGFLVGLKVVCFAIGFLYGKGIHGFRLLCFCFLPKAVVFLIFIRLFRRYGLFGRVNIISYITYRAAQTFIQNLSAAVRAITHCVNLQFFSSFSFLIISCISQTAYRCPLHR